MKFISWNVNGLRAAVKKGFEEIFATFDADVFAVQETKLQAGQIDLEFPGYRSFWSYAARPGYSGTAVWVRESASAESAASAESDPATRIGPGPVLRIVHGVGDPALDAEGRVCGLEFEDFWFVDCYTPNAQDGLARIDHRMAWDDAFRDLCKGLEEGVLPEGTLPDGTPLVEIPEGSPFAVAGAEAKEGAIDSSDTTIPTATPKPVVMCGDFNVAHEEIDLKNPKTNRGNAGFSDEERGKFTELIEAGFVDTFRRLFPDLEGAYSWWSYRGGARARNTGWRIDYFLVSEPLAEHIESASIYPEVMGSDHCPVGLVLE